MYQELMEKADLCIVKAMATDDINLKMFYFNASKGFEAKARKLTIGEA